MEYFIYIALLCAREDSNYIQKEKNLQNVKKSNREKQVNETININNSHCNVISSCCPLTRGVVFCFCALCGNPERKYNCISVHFYCADYFQVGLHCTGSTITLQGPSPVAPVHTIWKVMMSSKHTKHEISLILCDLSKHL